MLLNIVDLPANAALLLDFCDEFFRRAIEPFDMTVFHVQNVARESEQGVTVVGDNHDAFVPAHDGEYFLQQDHCFKIQSAEYLVSEYVVRVS